MIKLFFNLLKTSSKNFENGKHPILLFDVKYFFSHLKTGQKSSRF